MELIGEQISPVTSILPAHLNSIETIAAKPDGKELATGSHDHTIKIWDPETGKSNRTLEEHK
jgi:WD40 repeat protein